jgi:hypothetical protein
MRREKGAPNWHADELSTLRLTRKRPEPREEYQLTRRDRTPHLMRLAQ